MWVTSWAWAATVVVGNARAVDGAPLELHVDDGRLVHVGAPTGRPLNVDLRGATVLPAFVDSHVHLTYRPEARALAAAGVLAAVDLAAPLRALRGEEGPVRVLHAGPMITALGGYPTTSWGRDGYGLTCDGPAACAARVDELVAAGAAVVKVPVDGAPTLDDPTLMAVVERAHGHGRKVVVHALTEAGAARAAAAGADVLAHAPVEALTDATVSAWRGKAVIGTLAAFGGEAAHNLGRLHRAGAVVLYGTDFGNTSTAGISVDELHRMVSAGLSRREVLGAATEGPARFWDLPVGRLEVGREASFLVLDGDPLEDFAVLERPAAVWTRGQPR